MRTSVYNVLVMLSIIGAGNGWGATGGVVQNPWIWEEGNSIHRNRGVTQAELVRLTVNQKDDSAGRGRLGGYRWNPIEIGGIPLLVYVWMYTLSMEAPNVIGSLIAGRVHSVERRL